MNRFWFYLIGFALSLTGIQARAQKIIFLNKGEMFVKDSLFIQGDFYAEANSEVFQVGKTVLTGDFHNNVTSGNVFTTDAAKNSGRFEFRGNASQQITGTALKERNINFPDVLCINTVDASTTVTMQPNIAATVKRLDILNGRLVLDSKTQGDTASVNAHLLIESITGKTNNVQVNLALGDHYKNKRLVGFTSPFEKLYADYFFFNFLSKPTAKGLFGNDGRLITNPRTALAPGQGYIVGMGIIPEGDPYYATQLDPRWEDAKYSARAKDKFYFSRAVAEPTFSKYLNDQNAPGYITGEKLITSDIAGIRLEKGFNYLGNPYMAPLDLSDIVNGTTSADWGIPDRQLKEGFYVLSQGQGEYKDAKFTFSASYLITQKVGSTTNGSASVAPMQMFIVGSESISTLNIPAKKRKHDTKATFLRSAGKYEPTDELLIETKDTETGGYDRLCIVFRNDASLKSDDAYDAAKIFNRSGGVNQIFARSSDNKDMTVSVIPPSVDKMTMYLLPPATPQTIVLTADRISSLLSVTHVTLEDTKTGLMTDLMQTPSYTFASSPSDRSDRFVIHFNASPTAAATAATGAPSASYLNGALRIYGLNESDMGSDLSIFDMQGRLVHRSAVDATSPCVVNKRLAKGFYMVKNNNTVVKFAVKD